MKIFPLSDDFEATFYNIPLTRNPFNNVLYVIIIVAIIIFTIIIIGNNNNSRSTSGKY